MSTKLLILRANSINIFYLHADPHIAAQMHCDKHVVKMIVETAQMLSTAHRILDGAIILSLTPAGKTKINHVLSDPNMENALYRVSHLKHPCSQWVRDSAANYTWAYELMIHLSKQYELRYKRQHLTHQKLAELLSVPPKNIDQHLMFVEPPQCMPDQFKDPQSTVEAYRNFYRGDKRSFAKWNFTAEPSWF